MEEKIYLCLEDEAERLAELTGEAFETAYDFVIAEDEYCDVIGVNVYDDEPQNDEIIVVDVNDMVAWISEQTGISEDICYQLADAEEIYFKEIGVME